MGDLKPCPNADDGQHQLDTSMESGPHNCFYCDVRLPDDYASQQAAFTRPAPTGEPVAEADIWRDKAETFGRRCEELEAQVAALKAAGDGLAEALTPFAETLFDPVGIVTPKFTGEQFKTARERKAAWKALTND